MTAGEAKDRLEWLYEEGHALSAETKMALEAAITALEENQKLRAMVDALADRLNYVPIYDPCDDMWKPHGWCKEHCKDGQDVPAKECWIKWAEVMASE